MSLNRLDQEYLNNYLGCLKIVGASSSEIGYVVNSLDLELIAQAQPKQFGTRACKYSLMKSVSTDKFDIYRQKSITQQRVIKVLTVSNITDGGTFMEVISWRPIYNPETKNMIALLCLSHNLELFNLVDIFRRVYKTGNLISPRPVTLQLTQREQQVIFFFILNLDSHSIAEILTQIEKKNISENSINNMFTQQLFPKFKVFNRKALYDKLIESGFSRLMPSNILGESIVFEITDYIEFN